MTDIRFARNAGISVIGVGETANSRERLMPYADAVIPNISYLPDIIAEEWQCFAVFLPELLGRRKR